MGLEFDNKFGLVFDEDVEEVTLDEMKYVLNIGGGRYYETVNVTYQPDTNMYLVDDMCPSWRTLEEQIKFYYQLIKGLKKIHREVNG